MSTDMQVTSNDRSAAINSILNAVAESGNPEFIVELFTVARNQLKKLPNQEVRLFRMPTEPALTAMQRLYFTISIKLCRNLLEQGDLDRVEDLLRELHRLCQLPDGQDDRSKGSELLEVYALKVQYLAAQGDSVQLKELFVKTKDLSAEIKDPRSMSIIQVVFRSVCHVVGWLTPIPGMLGQIICFRGPMGPGLYRVLGRVSSVSADRARACKELPQIRCHGQHALERSDEPIRCDRG